MSKARKILGAWGEKKAKKYLLEKEYQIIATNYRTRMGEIDLIAGKADQIIFIEVKTRRNNFFGEPQLAVNHQKRNRIKKLATLYMLENNLEFCSKQLRFDVITIMLKSEEIIIRHFKNAF